MVIEDEDGCPDISPDNVALDSDDDGIRDTIDYCVILAPETYNNLSRY